MKYLDWLLAIFIFCSLPLHAADCSSKTDHRSEHTGGILVDDMVIRGTRILDSNELAGITSHFTGSCFDESDEELGERILLEFKNRGFFTSKLDSLRVKPRDPLASPKPVSVEAEVHEGLRYRLSAFRFINNRAFSSGQLRAAFPIHLRDRVETDKIASGLEQLRKLYGKKGYIDFTSIPTTTLGSNATLALTVDTDEGPQYHMGKFEVQGPKELADFLQPRWNLAEGAVFDQSYLATYLRENQEALGKTFEVSDAIRQIRNCRDHTIEIHIVLPGIPAPGSPGPVPDIDCDKKAEDPGP